MTDRNRFSSVASDSVQGGRPAVSSLAIDTDVVSAGVRPPTVRRSFVR